MKVTEIVQLKKSTRNKEYVAWRNARIFMKRKVDASSEQDICSEQDYLMYDLMTSVRRLLTKIRELKRNNKQR